ncbi:MAG: hypothetical protein HFI71_01440 [Lachnospiraceae bacterium]|nr:hypothetical protein [Lachnospiraceae bacterium]
MEQVYVVDSVDCLYQNGRIGKKAAGLCNMFSLHPILSCPWLYGDCRSLCRQSEAF